MRSSRLRYSRDQLAEECYRAMVSSPIHGAKTTGLRFNTQVAHYQRIRMWTCASKEAIALIAWSEVCLHNSQPPCLEGAPWRWCGTSVHRPMSLVVERGNSHQISISMHLPHMQRYAKSAVSSSFISHLHNPFSCKACSQKCRPLHPNPNPIPYPTPRSEMPNATVVLKYLLTPQQSSSNLTSAPNSANSPTQNTAPSSQSVLNASHSPRSALGRRRRSCLLSGLSRGGALLRL